MGAAEEDSATVADGAAEDVAGSDELAGRLEGSTEETMRDDVPEVPFDDISTKTINQ